jgi:hypothetical protein
MPIDTLTGKNWQFPLRIVYLKHDFIQLYFLFRQISKNYYMYMFIENIKIKKVIFNSIHIQNPTNKTEYK